ncbi:MAG: ABC transporter ATP-binding protein [Deltaproteobacteria bacterium]|nr:ABC transporter ATP-binding protein [Deltaproteobacteria bacterium]
MDKVPVFRIADISFSYGNVSVLRHVSLEMREGNFYGILGPNGSGKTTLLDVMAGIKAPDSGRVLFKGKDIRNYNKKELAKGIALVPQEFYINFPFTVKEIVLMGRHPYMPRFGAASADEYVTELSGGEKQRVVFARALAQDTPVLMLDEGTSNMDIRHTLKILGIARHKVRKDNRTVIAAMHDLNLAAQFCDHLVFLKDGKIVAQGPIDTVLNEQNVKQTFEVEAKIYFDEYSSSRRVAYRIGPTPAPIRRKA